MKSELLKLLATNARYTHAELAAMLGINEEEVKKEIETSAGGGAVVVKATGDKVIKSITIKEEVVDKDDVEMLQDLILTAVNEALNKADSMMQSELGQFNIPGMF